MSLGRNESAPDLKTRLLESFGDASSHVFSQIAGFPLKVQTAAQKTEIAPAVAVRISITGALVGACGIVLSPLMCNRFASLLTGEEVEATSAPTTDAREAAVELIQQICGSAADRLRAAFGSLEVGAHAEDVPAEWGPYDLFVADRGAETLEFGLFLSDLQQHEKSEAGAPEQVEPAPSNRPAPTQPDESLLPASEHNLNLLLDIELGVSLRFGTRQMLLKDVVELCSGSVVELDRHVKDPVDLLIDGRVIARGEVVVVGGNYGIHILQVASRSEKIACLS